MGCFPSIVRWRFTQQSSVIEGNDPQISKSLDTNLQPCTSPSSLDTSIEPKSPTISINPPTPSAPPPDDQPKLEPIEIPISEINNKLVSLASTIRASIISSEETRIRLLSDLNAILSTISENSLVYTKLEILYSQLSTLYRTKEEICIQKFGPAMQKLPSLLKKFVELGEEEQREQARRQAPTCAVIQIFTLLGNVRAGCNAQRDLDIQIERKLGSEFEVVLGDLKDLGAWEAVMKWRVLGMGCGKRREEAERELESILEVRMSFSGLLMEFVEALREVD